MKRTIERCLIIFLCISGTVSFINVIILYWAPNFIPFSLFSAVRIVFLAYFVKFYWLVLLPLLICIMLYVSALAVYRQKLLFPLCSLCYYIYDFAVLLSLVNKHLHDDYWKTYMIHFPLTLILIVMLSIYCCLTLIDKSTKTSDGRE